MSISSRQAGTDACQTFLPACKKTFTIEGAATDVLADLRALRASRTKRSARVHAITIDPTRRRWWSEEYLPTINDGDATLAKEKLNTLVRQRLVTAETERHLDEVIAELEIRTRPRD
jgi:hypothetical protein